MSRLLVIGILAALAVVLLAGCGGDPEPDPTPQPPSPPPPVPAPADLIRTTPLSGAAMSLVPCKEGDIPITVENQDLGKSGEYLFVPKDMTFNLGDNVCLTLSAETEAHTFTVDELGIDVDLNPGDVVQHSYTFDKPGTFRLYCIPHETLGMVGTITVQ